MGSFLAILANVAAIINKGIGWLRSRSDQKTGAEIQEAKDAQSSNQAALDRARIDVANGSLSDAALDNSLRGPNGKTGGG